MTINNHNYYKFLKMAEQSHQHFHIWTTFTISLFFISFIVVFTIFLTTQNTLTLITFSNNNNNINNNNNNNSLKIPILGNFTNLNNNTIQILPILEPIENGTGSVSVFRPESKDPNFININKNNNNNNAQELVGEKIGNDLNFQGVPISEPIENGTGSVLDFRPESKDPNFNDNVGKNEGKNCNLYMGKWVRDMEYPIYKPGSCPYVDEAFDCQSNGRPDFEYLKWRWKPDDCHLPRFNATDFLVRLWGKRLMLVGDSMNRNEFESMLCILREGLPDKSKMYEVHGYKITKGRGSYIFKFVDFNCTIEFIRSHFLVREGTRINGQGNSNPTLSIDKIDKTAGKWKQADILVFNTAHWWTHGKTSRGKNYYKEGDHVYPRFDSVEAYRRAIKTWGEWIDKNMDPSRHTVFYRAYSSAHYRGGDWDSGGTCNGEKEPILSGPFLDTYPLKMKIVEETIQQMKVPVILLNVTRLTNYRKDGHPSIFGKIRAEGTKVSARKQDCSHWCLPGVPDAWNELIYATLVFQ